MSVSRNNVTGRIERRPAPWVGMVAVAFAVAVITTVLAVWRHLDSTTTEILVPVLVWFGSLCRRYGAWESRWR